MRRPYVWLTGVVGAIVITTACGGGSTPPPASNTGASPSSSSPGNISLDRNSYPVFPNADAGADPAVSAEQGGKGFKGEGWQTNTDFDLIGDPRAVKGGTYRNWMLSFPGTLRMAGPEWNTSINYAISALVYETLLTLHPTTLNYLPVLATHWQISPDKLTYRFRIDPNGRFSDGTPVTAEDVVASWMFHTDKSLQDLYFYTEFNKLERPVAESKYIVRIKAKELQWSNFLMAATGLRVFPAHALKSLDGARYLKDTTSASCQGVAHTASAKVISVRVALFRFGDGTTTGGTNIASPLASTTSTSFDTR